jgi:hypothetical protein
MRASVSLEDSIAKWLLNEIEQVVRQQAQLKERCPYYVEL